MPSKVLLDRIAALRVQLAELEALAAAEAPALPSGFVVSEIVFTDTNESELGIYMPDCEKKSYIIVPEELGSRVHGLWSRHTGVEFYSESWPKPPWITDYISWGYSPEEAVQKFYKGHDAENNPGWPNQSEEVEE